MQRIRMITGTMVATTPEDRLWWGRYVSFDLDQGGPSDLSGYTCVWVGPVVRPVQAVNGQVLVFHGPGASGRARDAIQGIAEGDLWADSTGVAALPVVVQQRAAGRAGPKGPTIAVPPLRASLERVDPRLLAACSPEEADAWTLTWVWDQVPGGRYAVLLADDSALAISTPEAAQVVCDLLAATRFTPPRTTRPTVSPVRVYPTFSAAPASVQAQWRTSSAGSVAVATPDQPLAWVDRACIHL